MLTVRLGPALSQVPTVPSAGSYVRKIFCIRSMFNTVLNTVNKKSKGPFKQGCRGYGNSHMWESYGNSHRNPVGMRWEWE